MNQKNSYQSMAVVWGSTEKVASKKAVGWALEHFITSLKKHALSVNETEEVGCAPDEELCILVSDPNAQPAEGILQQAGATIPVESESFGLVHGLWDNRSCIVVSGADTRGFVYALLELADRMNHCVDPVRELNQMTQHIEKPKTPVRSVARLFSSEIEDKPWFYDKTFWREYFTELATHRFNKFQLALGNSIDLGHDPNLKDNYFSFAYPFFVTVPGYDVHVRRLPSEEQKQNLDMLQFISREAKRRGIHFQLGLWIHDYLMGDSPLTNYVIEGVTPEIHPSYCRDALATLLKACPDIDGLTLRVHYESGIPEPAHEFWEVVLEGVHHARRPIEIDLHTKGVYDEMLQVALDTNMPIMISSKYHAEHTALPYHQSAIRESERVVKKSTTGPSLRTAGDRSYTRYGYADFLRKDRPYHVMYRIWPGSQRLLLWGDPALASGYGRYGNFDGSQGIEVMEPLSFKGRKDSGFPDGHDPYADPTLRFGANEDWKKYKYYYRVWGRSLYNPDADPDSWRRKMRKDFGAAAASCEEALAHSSRIIPLIISSHLPSAAQAVHWSEMPTNMTLMEEGKDSIYRDTPDPKTFGAVSPADPGMFYGMNEFVEDILKGKRHGKYSPIYVANHLDDLADTADQQLIDAHSQITDSKMPAFQRMSVDIKAVVGLGRFFARKFRAGVAYALFKQTGKKDFLKQTLTYYSSAKEGWLETVNATKGVYRDDLAFGSKPFMRGHWSDRVKDIEDDIAVLQLQYDQYQDQEFVDLEYYSVVENIFNADLMMARPTYHHTQPPPFRRKEEVDLRLTLPENLKGTRIYLHYRHVNQAETYVVTEMKKDGNNYSATIPGDYTDSPYSLIYYFELHNDFGEACIVPGLDENLANQPYYHLAQL